MDIEYHPEGHFVVDICHIDIGYWKYFYLCTNRFLSEYFSFPAHLIYGALSQIHVACMKSGYS